MMSHHQSTGFSSSLHSFFGSTLLLASVLKIVLTVVFVQHRTSISSSHPSNIHHHNEEDDADDVDFLQASASLTTPQPSPYTMRLEFLLHVLSNFLFILAGITFMASNEESVNRMQNLLDSSAFVNILIGVAMLVYGLCAFLITLAMGNSRNSNGRGVGINNAADNEMLPHHLPRPLPQQEFEGDITPRISSSNNSINSQKSLAGATEENTFFMKSIKLGGLGASPRRTVVARSLFNDSDQVDEFKSQADELLQQ